MIMIAYIIYLYIVYGVVPDLILVQTYILLISLWFNIICIIVLNSPKTLLTNNSLLINFFNS